MYGIQPECIIPGVKVSEVLHLLLIERSSESLAPTC